MSKANESMSAVKYVNIILESEGQNYNLEVDVDTAKLLLSDAQAAKDYIATLNMDVDDEEEEDCGDDDSQETESVFLQGPDGKLIDSHIERKYKPPSQIDKDEIWVSKRSGPDDLKATECFLNLMLKYEKEIGGRNRNKAHMWKTIADELVACGFHIGGSSTRRADKVRTKFKNLRRYYTSHCKRNREQGSKRKPFLPQFDKLADILLNEPPEKQDPLSTTIHSQSPALYEDDRSVNRKKADETEEVIWPNDAGNSFSGGNNKAQWTQQQQGAEGGNNEHLWSLLKSYHEENKRLVNEIVKAQNKDRETMMNYFERFLNILEKKYNNSP